MFCGQGCSLRDSSIPPKSLNRPIISNKYLDVGCKCLAYHFDILPLVSNSTLFAWNTVAYTIILLLLHNAVSINKLHVNNNHNQQT